MDNGQIPPVQYGQPVAPSGVGGTPMVQQTVPLAVMKKDRSGLIKTIVIVVLALVSVTFIGLFIWMSLQYKDASKDLDLKISKAVGEARAEQKEQDEITQRDNEKYPYRTFAGPADYGQLSFEYPKTWSVYIEADASNGGDFKAYLNPIEVNTVAIDTINALRVSIVNDSYESVIKKYQKEVEKKEPTMTVDSITVGNAEKGIQVTANKYSGTIPGTDLSGYVVVFKIRDKTVVMQTDSKVFEEDFNKLLGTIVFNA